MCVSGSYDPPAQLVPPPAGPKTRVPSGPSTLLTTGGVNSGPILKRETIFKASGRSLKDCFPLQDGAAIYTAGCKQGRRPAWNSCLGPRRRGHQLGGRVIRSGNAHSLCEFTNGDGFAGSGAGRPEDFR